MIDDIRNAFIRLEPQAEESSATAHFIFDEKMEFFEGHFSHESILPGVFQIEMVRITMEKLLGETLGIRLVKNSKFMQKVAPMDELSVAATYVEKDRDLQTKAIIKVGDNTVSKFTLFLTRQPGAPDSRS